MKYRAVVITISDKGSKGERVDTSGPGLAEMLKRSYDVSGVVIVPDEEDLIADTIKSQIDEKGVDLVVTTGGTGVGPRDVTPEATRAVIDKGAARILRGDEDGELPHHPSLPHFPGGLRHQGNIDHRQSAGEPQGGRRVPLVHRGCPAPRPRKGQRGSGRLRPIE